MRRKDQQRTTGSWEEQFLQSIERGSVLEDKLEDPREPGELTGSLESTIMANSLPEQNGDENAGIFNATLRASVHLNVFRLFQDLEAVWGKCESPIEQAMLGALIIVGRELMDSVVYIVGGTKYGDTDGGLDVLLVEPQAQLGEYRIDFLLTQSEWGPDPHPSRERTLSDGRVIPGTRTIEKKMVIECDGFDFHDRTKEQARKDRERDRALQSFGYRVFRYTGSDIWSDVFRCAYEAVLALNKEVQEEWRRL